MAGVPAASIAGNMVVTPDMVPPNPAPYDEEATFFNTLADDAEDTQKQWNAEQQQRAQQSAQSPDSKKATKRTVRQRPTSVVGGCISRRRQSTIRRSPRSTATPTEASKARSTTPMTNSAKRKHPHNSRQSSRGGTPTHEASPTAPSPKPPKKPTTFRTNAGSDITALDSRTKGTAPQAPALPQGGGNGIAVPVGKTGSGLPDETDPDEARPDCDGGTNAALARQPRPKQRQGAYKWGMGRH